MNERPLVVSIGTTHPWNIAGVGLDLLVGDEFDVRVLTVLAAVSAQDANGVHAVHPVPGDVVRAQLAAMPWQHVGAVRVGALVSVDAVRTVADVLQKNVHVPAVVDPVFSATLGGAFADAHVIGAIREHLVTRANVVLTPNLAEAAMLLDRAHVGRSDLAEAAQMLHQRGAMAVLLKGGHFEGEPADALAWAGGVDIFVGERLGASMRGTGCVLAMALACELARGLQLVHAVQSARSFVRSRIARQAHFAGLNVAY